MAASLTPSETDLMTWPANSDKGLKIRKRSKICSAPTKAPFPNQEVGRIWVQILVFLTGRVSLDLSEVQLLHL